jgi:hypothetical protein
VFTGSSSSEITNNSRVPHKPAFGVSGVVAGFKTPDEESSSDLSKRAIRIAGDDDANWFFSAHPNTVRKLRDEKQLVRLGGLYLSSMRFVAPPAIGSESVGVGPWLQRRGRSGVYPGGRGLYFRSANAFDSDRDLGVS